MTDHSNKIKVGVVDDSPLMRNLLKEAINAEEDMEVVGESANPYEAREMIKSTNVDVLTLDIEMPKMDGISFLKKIMTLRPMPVVMVSTLTQNGADMALEALELGAIDYVGKPLGNDSFNEFRQEIVEKIRVASQSRLNQNAFSRINSKRDAKRKAESEKAKTRPKKVSVIKKISIKNQVALIAIGSSTGGVERVRTILEALPDTLPPIVLVQHMTPHFIPNFADRLDRLSAIDVSIPATGEILKSGHAYLASNNEHLEIKKTGSGPPYRAQLVDKPAVSGHIASVDVMFESISKSVEDHAMGIILSGMGADGANGLKKMFDKDAYTLGENEESCLVYGMPRMAKEYGGICAEMTLDDIINEILSLNR